MNELQKTQSDAKSLDISKKFDKARKSLTRTEDEREACDCVFLLDCSGSMRDVIQNKRKIDYLREAVSPYLSDVEIISFASNSMVGDIPEPEGETNMLGAFQVYQYHYQAERILVVSDGLPDNEGVVLDTAPTLGTPIDVLYIGPGNDAGERFMRRLAEITGGRWTTISTVGELASTFGYRLTEGIRMLVDNTQKEKSNIISL